MLHKHRIIFEGSHRHLAREALSFIKQGGLLGQLRNYLVDYSLTLLKRPQSRLQGYLRLINIEPTNYCNQRCRFCATGLNHNPRPKGKMALATFKKITAELPSNCLIMLAGFGEPFINEELEAFLEHAATRGLTQRLDLYSNFGVISEPRIRGLLDHPFRRLVISLDSSSRETFIEQKGVDEFDKVWESLKILADEVKRRGRVPQQLIVQMIVTKKTLHERQKFIEAIRGLNLTPRLKRVNIHSPRFSPEQIKEFEVGEMSRYRHAGYSRRCEWVWGGLLAYWNGDVALCCQDPTGLSTYGNIHQDNIPTLLNTTPGRCEFRRRYFENPAQIDICRDCDIA